MLGSWQHPLQLASQELCNDGRMLSHFLASQPLMLTVPPTRVSHVTRLTFTPDIERPPFREPNRSQQNIHTLVPGYGKSISRSSHPELLIRRSHVIESHLPKINAVAKVFFSACRTPGGTGHNPTTCGTPTPCTLDHFNQNPTDVVPKLLSPHRVTVGPVSHTHYRFAFFAEPVQLSLVYTVTLLFSPQLCTCLCPQCT